MISCLNRASISEHGLDWDRMGAARGIVGSQRPEAAGTFLCRDESEASCFVGMNNTGGPVDVWAVDGVDLGSLVDNGSGFEYFPGKIPATCRTLLQRDL